MAWVLAQRTPQGLRPLYIIEPTKYAISRSSKKQNTRRRGEKKNIFSNQINTFLNLKSNKRQT